MNIPKAIGIGQKYRRDGEIHDPQDFENFIDLGIEALKRCRTLAQESTLWKLHPLPGETED